MRVPITILHFLLCSFFVFNLTHVSTQTKPLKVLIDCDDSLWNHVYHSYRLEVIEKCKRVTGTIIATRFEADVDVHILLKLDKGQENLLNEMNYESQDSCLVVEPICCSVVTQTSAKGICTGYVNDVYLPKVGEHVEVIGTFVLDTKHSWNEIHPVTRIAPMKN